MQDKSYGFCQCGCGEQTDIAQVNKARLGWIKGQPKRYLPDHYRRRRDVEPPNPSGLCLCGCGEPAPIATQTHKTHGYVKGEPMKYVRGHNNRGRPIKKDRWQEEDRGYETPCHIWRLGLNGGGYARSVILGRAYTEHRRRFEEAFGTLPPQSQVDHMCRQRDCVRLDHLRAVTPAQNMQNLSPQRGRASQHRGVSWDKRRGRWNAYVKVNGTRTYLGAFADEEEAAEAARLARRELMPYAVD
jgi:hypothetical protein